MPNKLSAKERTQRHGISGFQADSEAQSDFTHYLVAAKKQEITKVRLEYLNNTENIRKVDTNSEEFKNLKRSIERDGVLQNIVVEMRPDEQNKSLYIRAGGHRFTAKMSILNDAIEQEEKKIGRKISQLDRERLFSKNPELFVVPALIKIYKNPVDAISDSIRENEERNNLHFIDYADALALMLKTDANLTRELLANKENKNRKTIDRFLKISEMPLEVKRKFREYSNIFTRSFVWNNYATRKISHEDLIKDVNNRISAKEIPVQKTLKDKRRSKLEDYYKSVNISDKVRIEIDKAFKHMNLI